MGMQNLRGRTGRGAPWLVALAILGALAQLVGIGLYVAAVWSYGRQDVQAGAWTPLMSVVLGATTITGLALVVLTFAATFRSNKAVVANSIAGLGLAIALPMLAYLGMFVVGSAATNPGSHPFSGLILFVAFIVVCAASSGLFLGFAISLAVAATQRQPRVEPVAPQEPLPSFTPSGTLLPLPLKDGDELP